MVSLLGLRSRSPDKLLKKKIRSVLLELCPFPTLAICMDKRIHSWGHGVLQIHFLFSRNVAYVGPNHNGKNFANLPVGLVDMATENFHRQWENG